MRGENLSFTEIAKRVGDRWQKLSAAEKEPFESQANAAKEKFNAEHAQYKKTDAYKEYTQYVADFKAKHSVSTSDGKRPKLEHESSGGSGSSKTNEAVLDSRPHVSSVHTRDISIGSLSSTSFHGDLPSPQGGNTGLPPSMTGYSVSAHLSRISSSLTMHSPPEKHDRRDARVPHAILVHASLAGQAQQIRGDLPELHSRTGQLSLAPASHGMNLPSGDSGFGGRTAPVFPPPLPQHPTNSSVSSVAYSDSSSNSNPGPITPADEPWRFQPPDAKGKSSEWPRLYNPLPANNYSTSMNQLPPLQPSDRVPDLSRDPNQRTLPLPAPSSPHDLKTLYRGPPRHPASLAPSESSVGSPSEPRDEMRSPLETSENDAANALAVLAYTGR